MMGGDESRQICVLENGEPDPMEGEWEWKGALPTPVPGLDGTVMSIGDQLYFLYAGTVTSRIMGLLYTSCA